MASTSGSMFPYSNKASTYLVPVITLGVFTVVLVVARIYTRITRTGKLRLDDKLILIAGPLSLASVVIAIAATAHGWGKPMPSFAPEDLVQTIKPNFALQTVWLITFCLVRLSVACSLLRFGFGRSWRWPLYLIMGLQVLLSSSYFVIQLAQCKPLSANWDSVPGAICWDLQPIIRYGWVVAATYIVMDLILSLMPIRLVRTLRRSTSEKILICFLMSLGLLATGISCAKMSTFTTFGKGDMMQATIKPSLWAKLEEQVGIIASSLPCLKNPMEVLLSKWGLLKEHRSIEPSFINEVAVSMPSMIREQDEESGETDVRVDSVAVTLGNTNTKSDTSLPAQVQIEA